MSTMARWAASPCNGRRRSAPLWALIRQIFHRAEDGLFFEGPNCLQRIGAQLQSGSGSGFFIYLFIYYFS